MSLVERPPVLEIRGLKQVLRDPGSGETFTVLVDVPIVIAAGAFVALLGPSGCGKTTLLSVMGLLRAPTSPESLEAFLIRSQRPDGSWETYDLKEIWTNRKRSRVEQLRRGCVGFALQSGELLSSLTVAENIAVPLRLNGAKKTKVNQRVEELLLAFKLKTRNTDTNGTADFNRSLASQRINRLSGGEYQRVALARAIVHQPTLLFVDEPTSALNRELAYGALNELRSLQCNEEARGAVVMITHDEELAAMFADTIIRMAPRRGTAIGEVVSIEANVPRLPELILADPVAGSFT